jgi:hypothetical protein
MAGDWIKMRSNLRRHPKVVRLASASNADRLRVVGGLHAVWCLFDEHSEDGCLYGYTPSAVDEEIGWPGFCDLLIAIGWVETDGRDGLSLPDFEKQTANGPSAQPLQTIRTPSMTRPHRMRTRSGPEERRKELPLLHYVQ